MYKQVCLWEAVKVKFYRETFTMCGAGCEGQRRIEQGGVIDFFSLAAEH
jgi:hypothetical protein